MRSLTRRAALLLLPALIQAFVLPNQIPDTTGQSGPSRFDFEQPVYGGPSTFFRYDDHDNSIKFTIPCPDCSDEERELLERKILSLRPIAQDTRQCTSSDSIGLEIDGEPVISSGESSLTLQSHVGPLNSTDVPKRSIFSQTRWINNCGCTIGNLEEEDCSDHWESTFAFEILGLASGQVPGFTISYQQMGNPRLLRFSTFPDTDIANSWKYGQSSHYMSPLLLGLQMELNPTSIAIISSDSNSPSSTTSAASSPSYTLSEKTPSIVTGSSIPPAPATTPSISGILSQPLDSESQSSLSQVNPSVPHGWCHLPAAFTALGHGLEAIGMKAKSGAQIVLGKVENVVSDHRSQRSGKTSVVQPSPSVPTTQAELDNGVLHDELDDVYDVVEDLELTDSDLSLAGTDEFLDGYPSQASTIKAFQVTSLVFIIVALSGSIYALVRRNPRLRAKWATCLEERRNQRLYRQAVRKQRFMKFFGRSNTTNSSGEKAMSTLTGGVDWQEYEKRIPFNENDNRIEDIKSTALRQDLLAFRKAHQFVDNIISAEEGRRSSTQAAHRSRHQRSSSFGSEKTAPPPPYESDGEGFMLDADIPRYISMKRGKTILNISPDSSVVSTSPHTSCADSDSEHDEKS